MMTLQEAMDRLAKFKTADGLARFLKNEGVTGVPVNAGECPVAQWVTKQTGQTNFGSGSWWATGPADSVHTPKVVAEFIHAFDSRKRYKFLQEK